MKVRRGFSLRGAALVTALAFSAMLALIVAGAATLAVSNLNSATREADYAAAIQLAEAGINYELRYMSADPTNPNYAHQLHPATGQPGAFTGSVSTVTGTFTVYVTNDPDNGSSWSAPNNMIITSTGTVNGVSRTVQARGTSKSIFDEYAMFGVYGLGLGSLPKSASDALTFNGSGSVINGNVGSNGHVDSDSSGQINGDLTLTGPLASGTSGANVYSEGDQQPWPTVDEIANARFPGGGLTWLRTNHDNGNLKQFAASGATVDNTISAGFPTSGSNQYSLQANNFNSLNVSPSGVPVPTAYPGLPAIPGLPAGVKTLIFPPGNYYFENLSVTANTVAVLIDNRSGPVTIWVNTPPTGNSNDDTINSNFYYLDSAPSKFRLYYNKCNRLSVGGNTTFNGGFYAWREGCNTNSQPSLNFTGGSVINGSVIAGLLTVAGGTIINFPAEGAGAGDDFSLWFGFKDQWTEVAITGANSKFVDGTDK